MPAMPAVIQRCSPLRFAALFPTPRPVSQCRGDLGHGQRHGESLSFWGCSKLGAFGDDHSAVSLLCLWSVGLGPESLWFKRASQGNGVGLSRLREVCGNEVPAGKTEDLSELWRCVVVFGLFALGEVS